MATDSLRQMINMLNEHMGQENEDFELMFKLVQHRYGTNMHERIRVYSDNI